MFSSHGLSPFEWISNKEAYHKAEKIKRKTKSHKNDINLFSQELTKDERSGHYVRQVHQFISNEFSICFHSANYIKSSQAVSR